MSAAKVKRFATYGLPPILLMALIFPLGNRGLGSSRLLDIFAHVYRWLVPHASAEAVGLAYIVLRKTSHFLCYGLLAFLLYRAFRAGRGPFWRKKRALLAAAAAIAYSFLDEFLQSFVPNRIGSPYDWIIDTAGILTAIALIAWMGARRDAGPTGRQDGQDG
jgi:VanZ family protein